MVVCVTNKVWNISLIVLRLHWHLGLQLIIWYIYHISFSSYIPRTPTPLAFWSLYYTTMMSRKYWSSELKIVTGAIVVAKWIQNHKFLLPFVRILIVMWKTKIKSIKIIAHIDDPMRQCNSCPRFCSYGTKSLFSCHKYTVSSSTRVGPTISSATPDMSRSLPWDETWNNDLSDCADCCALSAGTKDDFLKAKLCVQCRLIQYSLMTYIVFLQFFSFQLT